MMLDDIGQTVRRLGNFDLVILILASPAVCFPTQFPLVIVVLVIAVGFSVWVAGRYASRASFWNSHFNLAILLVLLMVFPSLYASADWTVSLSSLTRILFGVLLFSSAGAHWKQQKNWLRPYWRVIPAAGVGFACLMLIGIQWINKFQWLAPIYDKIPHLMNTVPHYADVSGYQPNPIAANLLFIVPVLFAIALEPWETIDTRETNENANQRKRSWGTKRGIQLGPPLRLGAALLVTTTLVLTQSRSALLGFGVALFAWSAYRYRRWRPVLLLLAVIGLFGFFLAFGAQVPTVLLGGADNDSVVGNLSSFQDRIEMWQRAVYMLQDAPYTGIGLGMFGRVMAVLYPISSVSPDTILPHAHNQLLQVGVDLGLPGLVAYVCLITVFFVWTARVMGQSQSCPVRALAAGLFFGMLAYQVFGLFDAVALGSEPSLLFWIVLAMAVSLNGHELVSDSDGRRRKGSIPEGHDEFIATGGPAERAKTGNREMFNPIVIWVAGSLLSISFIGDQPYMGLTLAVLSGIVLGLASVLAYDRAHPETAVLQSNSSISTSKQIRAA